MEKKIEVIGNYHNHDASRIVSKNGIAPTVKENHGTVTATCKNGKKLGGDRVEEEKTIDDYLYTANDGEQYGIFKLSPRECGRLMGVLDSDIDKMLDVNSNSQCYK